MKVWSGIVGCVLALSVSSVLAEEKKTDPCHADLGMARAQVGNYQNDYVRKVNELSQVQLQLAAANQKIKMLEEAAKKTEAK